jgi:uracil phosphoribosyltransferase
MNKSFRIFFCINLILSTTLHGSHDSLYLLEDNPLKDSILTILRDKETECAEFREATSILSNLLAYKVSEFLPTEQKIVYTLTDTIFEGVKIKKNPILISIMRSGLSLLPIFQKIFKGAPVGIIGHKRDEKTAQPMLYYLNLPNISHEDKVVVLEPMLATGGSLSLAVSLLKQSGVSEENIIIATVIAAPPGIERLFSEYPGITIIVAALDPALNDKWYIVPGLGDYGDRYFGNDSQPFFSPFGLNTDE